MKNTPPTPAPLLSRRGWRYVGLGVFLCAIGFWVLTYSDPAGQNAASTLSPFLLLLGYSVIGVGIVVKDPFSQVATPPILSLPPSSPRKKKK